MGLPSVNIPRQNGQLNLTVPSEDSVVCYLLSGTAVAGKIQLNSPTQIFGTAALATLGITLANNALAYNEILAFYDKAGEGAELNFMLTSNATSFTDICDKNNNILKKLVDFTEGRGVIIFVNKTFPDGYARAITTGLDSDIVTAIDKLNAMAEAYDNDNIPFVAVLPGYGFTKETIADLPARATLVSDYVALSFACDKSDGIVSLGTLAGWVSNSQVQVNIAAVARGKVSNTGFFPDATPVLQLKDSLSSIHDKGFIIYRKIGSKSGYFYNDDPTYTDSTSDYSSISWNRIINKAKRLAATVLIEKLNGDVDTNPSTGKIESTLAADWESDVETAIRNSMIKVPSNKVKEISGVKCAVSVDSDILNNEVDATLSIVRKGQAKTIIVKIRYTATV